MVAKSLRRRHPLVLSRCLDFDAEVARVRAASDREMCVARAPLPPGSANFLLLEFADGEFDLM